MGPSNNSDHRPFGDRRTAKNAMRNGYRSATLRTTGRIISIAVYVVSYVQNPRLFVPSSLLKD